ncbi:MAG TPA: hypothetical protein VFK16_00130 [Gemmatimonadaceae bacterium]|jgi:hypothetical protein|nr:hypothetical protein [Gemmatimonadaceae bacterium]
MTTLALHQPPTYGTVIQQQLRNAAGALRGAAIGLFAAALLFFILLTLLQSSGQLQGPGPSGFNLNSYETIPVWFVALIAAGALWQRDEPTRRGYHLAMPVNAAHHTAMRVGAGWAWLMVWVAVYLVLLCLLGLVLTLIGGGQFTSQMGWWGWLAPFAAATMSYLLASIPFVASEKPLAWIVAVPGGFVALITLPYMFKARALTSVLDSLMAGPFSPQAPFFPMFFRMQSPAVMGPRHPLELDWQTSVTAAVVWTIIGLVGVWLATRHRARGAQ